MKKYNLTTCPQPVRILHKTSPHRTVGGFSFEGLTPYPSEYESYNEQNAINLLALCHDVKEIRSQPRRFSYIKQDGTKGSHIADFEVITESGSIFLEVKAIENLLEKSNIQKYSYIARHYLLGHERLNFLTNVQMEQKPIFDTVQLLRRYINSQINHDALLEARQVLSNGAKTINQLLKHAPITLLDVYTLIARRYLCFDTSISLERDTQVSMPNQPFKGLSIESILRSTRYGDLLEKLAMGRVPSDQSMLAAAKNWRQINNHPTIWGVVGGFSEFAPIRHISEIGFLRGAQYRRYYAPGFLDSKKYKK